MSKTRYYVIAGLFLGAILSRLVPHPANWTAVGAFAIWSGFFFRDRWVAVLMPLILLLVTDLILRTHVTMPWTFASCAMITLLARTFTVHRSGAKLLGASLISSVLFFAITNFGTWVSTGFYTRDWEGLVTCFTLACPFFSSQVTGDLFYVAAFTAVVQFAKLSAPAPVPTKAS